MFWYIGFVALLNLGLGFAVAVHLGRRYRDLLGADDPFVMADDPALSEGGWGEIGPPENPAPMPAEQPSPDVATSAEQEPAAADPEDGPQQKTATHEEAGNTERLDDATVETVEEPRDGAPPTPPTDESRSPNEDASATPVPAAPESDLSPEPPSERTAETEFGTVSEPQPPVSDVSDYQRDVAEEPGGDADEQSSRSEAPPEDRPPVDDHPPHATETSGSTQSEPQPEHLPDTEIAQPSVETAGEIGTEPTPEPESELEPRLNAEASPGSEEELDSALNRWQQDVQRYYNELSRVGNNLRQCQQDPQAGNVKEHLDELRAANQEYVRSGQKSRESFEMLAGDREEFAEVQDDLAAAARRQVAMIAETNQAIERFEDRSEPQDSCRQMAEKTADLMDVNRWVRNALQVARVRVEQAPQDSDAKHEGSKRDPLTGLATHDELVSKLQQWWEEDPERTRNLAVAMIEVDEFSKINLKYGRKVGDKTLQAIARFLENERTDQGLTVRLDGKRFAYVFYGADLREATAVAERIRQVVAKSRFTSRDQQFRLNVSCGITEATAEDSPEALLARAEVTLQQAKRYGGNRGFSHDGTFPVPVPAQTLPIDAKEIRL